MVYFVALLVATLSLGGCASAEKIAARHQQECASYGFAPGTTQFAQCRMLLAQREDDSDRRAGAAFAAGLNNYSAARQQAYRAPTTCRTRKYGGTLTTTCD
jgi:hypothetical protein